MPTSPVIPTPADLPKPEAPAEPAAEAEETPADEATPETPETGETGKTFTQDEVNTIVSKRVAELNSKLADLEKAVAGKPDETTEDPAVKEALAEAQAALAAANQQATAARLEAAVTTAAIKAGVPPEKIGYVAKLAETADAVTDGSVDADKVAAAVGQVLEGLPELVTAPPKPVGNGPVPTHQSKPLSWREAIRKDMGIG